MHKIYKNIFTPKQCQNLIQILNSNISEHVETNTGEKIIRSYLNEKWQYFFTRFHNTEVKTFIESINKKMSNYDIISFRTIHYPPGAMIGRHTDTYMEQDGKSDTGLIIQLTDPTKYRGGYLRMSNELMELDQGDGVLYSYDTPHEVTKIKSGDRWIASVRMLQKR